MSKHRPPVSATTGPVIARQTTTTWSGPIPDPSSLAAYQQIVPDAGERIPAMAEEEARCRRERTDKDHASENLTKEVDVRGYHEGIKRGQYLSFVLIMSCIAGAIYCVRCGAYTVAGIISSTGFAGIAAQFIPRRK